MLDLVKHYEMTAEQAYSKWNMGNDGYITTKNPEKCLKLLKENGLEGRAVGVVLV